LGKLLKELQLVEEMKMDINQKKMLLGNLEKLVRR